MKKGRKRKISVVNTTSNTLVATFRRGGDNKSFPNFTNNLRERSRDGPEAEASEEVGPGDDGTERGSVPGQTRGRRSDGGKLNATITKRPGPKSAAATTKRPISKSAATTTKCPSPTSAATTTKHPSPRSAATGSSKSATGHCGHSSRRPEAGGRHSCKLENIASSTAGHNGSAEYVGRRHRKNQEPSD